MGGLDAVFRAISFAGLAVTLGGACLLLLLWPDGRRSRRGRRLLWAGIWRAAGGHARGAAAAGALRRRRLRWPACSKPSMLSFSLATRFGHALIMRLVLAATFAVLVALGLRGARDRRLAGRWRRARSGSC